MSGRTGIVVIGRNEGERLVRCLESVLGQGRIVYVDSGSTDGSVGRARELGADVVELDMSKPFTAARARNAGFARLRELEPDVEFVQFVDGDCEIETGWLDRAAAALRKEPTLAAVCGRLLERNPQASIYNRLCQMEWDGPTGPIHACGGNAMFRVGSLVESGAFRESMIAGEEPELCFRLRKLGRTIVRLEAPMAHHDAAMTRLSQWLRRTRRGGHAFAECFWLHRSDRFRARESARILFWGLALPVVILASILLAGITPWALVGVAVGVSLYFASCAKLVARRIRGGTPRSEALMFGAFTTLGRVPEAVGVLQFALNAVTGRHTGLIEYKRGRSTC